MYKSGYHYCYCCYYYHYCYSYIRSHPASKQRDFLSEVHNKEKHKNRCKQKGALFKKNECHCIIGSVATDVSRDTVKIRLNKCQVMVDIR